MVKLNLAKILAFFNKCIQTLRILSLGIEHFDKKVHTMSLKRFSYKITTILKKTSMG